MRKQAVALTVGVVVAALLAGGCGSDGDSDADTGAPVAEAPPIAKAAFIKKADSICQATSKKLLYQGSLAVREGLKEGGKPRAEIEADLLETLTIPLFQAQIDEIRALGAPAGDEAQVDAFLDAIQKVIDEAREDPEAYHAAQVNFERPYDEAEDLARAYGISSCPQG